MSLSSENGENLACDQMCLRDFVCSECWGESKKQGNSKGQKPTRRWSLLKICEVDVIHDLDAHRIES
jgi:hypothetical protein